MSFTHDLRSNSCLDYKADFAVTDFDQNENEQKIFVLSQTILTYDIFNVFIYRALQFNQKFNQIKIIH